MSTRRFITFGALVLLARSASAQATGSYATTFSANVDVAYHETGDDSFGGAHFDVAGTVKRDVPRVAIVGEAGFNHFSDATVVSVLGGARVRIPIPDNRFLPFAQGLLGLYHCSVCKESPDDNAVCARSAGNGHRRATGCEA